LGVVHRDIKLANLMVDARGQVWITDFGLALLQHGEPGLTLTGDLVGTLRYMSPEQALAKRAVIDHRTDVYSLGATLYELLTLQPVFGGDDKQELLRQIAFEEPAAPRKLNKAVPAELETIVLKALEKDPSERYATAQELADDLRRFLDDKPIQARRPSVLQRVRKWSRRHKPLVRSMAALVLITAIAAGGLWTWWAQKQAVAEGEARAALREAGSLMHQEHWPEALSAARRAEAVLASLGGHSDLLRQVRALIGELEMARRLQEVGLHSNGPKEAYFSHELRDADYTAAFREYGLDTDALDTPVAAEQIRGRPIHQQLVAALEFWAATRKHLKRDGWKQRLAVARAADPDPLRNRLRDFLEGKDPKALDELADAKEAQDWPVPTFVLLGTLAQRKDSGGRVAAVLERARQQHLNDFSINETLGVLLLWSQPPRVEEAIRFYTVAVALRPVSPGAHQNLGTALAAKGRLEEAMAEYRQALCLDQDDPGAHYNLGDALREKGRLDEAIAEFREAIRLKQDFFKAHVNLGIALADKGRLDEAIAEYRQALCLDQDDPGAHNNLGNALMEKDRLDKAIAEFHAALRLKKDFPVAHYNLGQALGKQGKLKEAEAAFRKAIHFKPDYPGAHANLGNVLRDHGRHKEAEAAYRKALRLQPDLPIVHNNLGATLNDQQRYQEAEAAVREAIRLKHDSPEAHVTLGAALVGQGRHKEAEEASRDAIRLKHDCAGAYFNLGKALEGQGRHKEAERAYRVAIRLEPDDAEAHYNIGISLQRQGKYAEAEAAYREAIRIKPDHVEAHNNLGVALGDKGRLEEAIDEYREAIRLKKDFAEVHSNLGNALIKKGLLDEAIAAWQEATVVQPNFPSAHFNLGKALREKGQPDKAVGEFREAIRLKQDYPEAHFLLGQALRQMGQLDNAIAEYREALLLNPDYADVPGNLGLALMQKGLLDDAIAAFRLAIRLKTHVPVANYNLGNALRRKGQLDDAIAAYREAIRIREDYAEAHCNLAETLLQQGRFQETVQEYRRGHDLGSRKPGWPYPSAQWLRKAERVADLDARLPALLNGQEQPKDAGERMALAKLCQQHKRLYAAAARWYGEAFDAQPGLAEDQTGNRYNAAALAGCGQGHDARGLSAKERERLRKQALDWLKGDLRVWGRLLEAEPNKAGPGVASRMAHWLNDSDFTGVRGAEALFKLPQAERGEWQKLWGAVEALWQRAANPPAKAADGRP
jgi:tetratricopeptide (TPR) repeat protein